MPARLDFAPGEFCWIDHSAHDMQAASAWYSEIFGWQAQEAPSPAEGAPPYAFLMKGEACVGGMGQMDDAMKSQGVPPCWNVYVCVEDCEAAEAKAKELGANVIVPTMDVPGHGKLCFFFDPAGACCAMWQNTAEGGPGVLVDEHGGRSWIELMTKDVSAAKEFYGALFGWTYADMPMGEVTYTMIKCGEIDAGGMMALEGPQMEGVPPHWMTYFAVDDCDGVAAKVAESGGQVRVPPTEIPVGKFSVLADPHGGGFSVIQTREGCEE